jgi:glutamate-1-semialdehyde 2,1-aminomutase
MFGFFFREETVRNYQDAKLSNVEVFKKVFHGMLSRGIYLAPSAFEAGFVSLAHTSQDISLTLDSFDHVLGNIK